MPRERITNLASSSKGLTSLSALVSRFWNHKSAILLTVGCFVDVVFIDEWVSSDWFFVDDLRLLISHLFFLDEYLQFPSGRAMG
jgi:hypothetical protein